MARATEPDPKPGPEAQKPAAKKPAAKKPAATTPAAKKPGASAPPPPPPPPPGDAAPPPPPPPPSGDTAPPPPPPAPPPPPGDAPPPPPPPPPGPDGEAPAAARPARPLGRTVGIIAAAALVIAALVIAGVIFVPQLMSGSTTNDAGATDEPHVVVTFTPAPEPTDDPDETDEADETEAPTTVAGPPLEFKSTSGNIRCRITEESVVCRQGDVKYAVPAANCSSLSGATIGVSHDGAFWPCIGKEILPKSILAYDTPASRYGFTCSINYTTGVTCTNSDGNGFRMEYTSGIQTF